MKSAETCSCSLRNQFYTCIYHRIVVLDKYIHSNLVYYKHNGDDEPYGDLNFLETSGHLRPVMGLIFTI